MSRILQKLRFRVLLLASYALRSEGEREGEREGGREGGRQGGRQGGRERGREGGKEGEREGGRRGIAMYTPLVIFTDRKMNASFIITLLW